MKSDTQEKQLLDIKIYYGFKPYYRPWVEFSNITHILKLGKTIEYFDSKFEDYLLEYFQTIFNQVKKFMLNTIVI